MTEPSGMDVAMELICTLAVVNRQGGVIEDFSRGSITVTSMNTCETPPKEPFIIVRTSSDDIGTKYDIIGNIEDLVIEFLNEGRSTVCLEIPSYNIIINEADPNELAAFTVYIKEQLPKYSPLYVSTSDSEPSTNKIYLDGQEKYKLRMENIIKTNINLDQFIEMKIINCILKLADYQVPIAGAIRNMKNLTALRLEGIELHSSTFLEIESKELKHLHLSWCENQLPIASLFKNDLCYKDSLIELNLEGNQLSEIPNGVFQFQNLLKLSLRNNGITELPDKLTNLSKLKELSLSYNRLTHVPPSIFALQNLSVLLFGDNLISELPDMFTNLPKLEALILYNNHIEYVPSSIFALQNLSELELRINNITELPDMFTNLPKLKYLSLSNNQLTHLPPSIFRLQNLLKLSLNANLISDLPNTLANLPKLETLLLCDNRLRYVPAIVFEMQNLSELSLIGNYITELPDKFTNLSKLKYLLLSNNQLTHLPPSICSLRLEGIDIESNPFNYEIPPEVGSELIVHSLKELSYRAILNHKLKVEEGMLPKKFLKVLSRYQQCICGCKFVDEGQDLLFFCNVNDVSRFTDCNRDPNLKFPVRSKTCTSLKSCLPDHFSKCK